MSTVNVRMQHAVGQGFFHTSEVFGERFVRFVYDCGAMTKYAKARDGEIDNYVSRVGKGQTLDVLFISHAHADHINGIEQLLDGTNGLVVKTIVLPLLNLEDRLVAFARAATEDPLSAQSSFYQAFVADPTSALGRFNPDRIIFVKPGRRDNGAPFSNAPNDPDAGRPDLDPSLLDDERLKWKFVGEGTIEPTTANGEQPSNCSVLVMSDTLGLIIPLADSRHHWLMAPFVDPIVKAHTMQFIAALASVRGQTVAKLKKWLRGSGNIKQLLTDHAADLKTAYAAVSTDLNITSMCLYSGPVPRSNAPKMGYHCSFGMWRLPEQEARNVAWLGTGDAALGDKKRRAALFKHYGHLLRRVVTLTLPHHGSDHNFHPALLEHINPSFCIASADRFSNWRHPGAAVVQAASSMGRFVSVVTSDPASKVWESVALR